jgi:carbamoyltransferase
MFILGINAHHAGASACLIQDGRIVAAIEEERLNRQKYWAGFPTLACRWVLCRAGITAADLDHAAISRDPSRHFLKKVQFVLRHRPSLKVLLDRAANARDVRNPRAELAAALGCAEGALRAEVHNVEHHLAHMASAFFVSPYDRAAVLSIDGMGDFCSAMWGDGTDARLTSKGATLFPHSLGFLYTAISQWLGFPGYGDEGKVMALAAFGAPRREADIRTLVSVGRDGSFELNLDYFAVHTDGATMSWEDGMPVLGPLFSSKLVDLLGPVRDARTPLTQDQYDVAASLQAVVEDAVFRKLRTVHAATGLDRVCLAGGVALNSCINGKIPIETPFRSAWVQPAAGDAGTAMGACYYVWHQVLGQPRTEVLRSPALGPDFTPAEIAAALDAAGMAYRTLDDEAMDAAVSERLADGAIVGWFQGRMEWGPRALGHRSILADPRRADMKAILNARVKHREAFRPFAPSILEEATGDWFAQSEPDPFMVKVYAARDEVKPRIPAALHVDGTGRLQTVSRSHANRYWRLINAFGERTGVPIVVNTSFNDNEPIVCTPQNAIDCFQRTHMDVLALGPYLVSRT